MTKTDIVALLENPVVAFTDKAAYSEFYEKVKAEVTAHEPDVSSERGRKEIASLAYKVTRSKTAIDAAGKKLNEEKRAAINRVDAQRRKIREELDSLAADVRRPLTEWEEAEKERLATVDATIAELESLIHDPAPAGVSAEVIDDRRAGIEAEVFDPAVYGDRLAEIEELRAKALDAVRLALERRRQHEADQAELARLRQEQEDRDRREREEREAAQSAERERLRREREAAELKAREELAAQRAREEEQRKAREAIEKAEAEAREARQREQARQAAEEKQRREDERRAADRAHRGKVMTAAKEAIMTAGDIKEDAAKKIVLAIAANDIPNTVIRF